MKYDDTILTEMDRDYMLFAIQERKEVLLKRWKLLLQNKDRHGKFIQSVATVNKYKVQISRDLELCSLVEELLMRVKDSELKMSEQAEAGFQKLCEPSEREVR